MVKRRDVQIGASERRENGKEKELNEEEEDVRERGLMMMAGRKGDMGERGRGKKGSG